MRQGIGSLNGWPRGFWGSDGMSLMAKRALPVLAVALLLAGCGVRGALQNPKADATGTPQPPQATATAESGQNKPENAASKPHAGFPLDGLLR